MPAACAGASKRQGAVLHIVLPGCWAAIHCRRTLLAAASPLRGAGLVWQPPRTQLGGALPGGILLRGLSGSERKRLPVAFSIAAMPSILFLDEPTWVRTHNCLPRASARHAMPC